MNGWTKPETICILGEIFPQSLILESLSLKNKFFSFITKLIELVIQNISRNPWKHAVSTTSYQQPHS